LHPQASQKPGVAYHDPIIEGAPGHGEGHNSGQPLNIVAAIAVKRVMERAKLPARSDCGRASRRSWSAASVPDPLGVLQGRDVALFAHVDNNMTVSWGTYTGTGLVSVEYSFKGESAHAAAQPWQGRSALDAVELMDVGWNFRREHLRLSQRSHYGHHERRRPAQRRPGERERVVLFPRVGLRAHQGLREIGDQMAQGAALMTNTTVSSRVLGSAGRRTSTNRRHGDGRKHQGRRPARVDRGRSETREERCKPN